MSSRVTRVVISSAGRPAGTTPAAYEARFPADLLEVTAVRLVNATIPYPAPLLVPGAFVVLRVSDMEATVSNDDVLNRAFAALPCIDDVHNCMPVSYTPVRPIRRLGRMRISIVDKAGEPVDFLGADHILQFDIEHGDSSQATGMIVPVIEATQAPEDPPAATDEIQPAVDPFAALGAELTELLKAGDKSVRQV